MDVKIDTQRERLQRAFEILKKRGITPILRLVGSTGVTDWDLNEFTAAARAAGTPMHWVGAAPGSEENGGVCWDNDGRLRYQANDGLVAVLYFKFPRQSPEVALSLIAALEKQAMYAYQPDRFNSVIVDLLEETR